MLNKKIKCLLIIFIMFLGLNVNALGNSNVVDLTKKGSIKISLEEKTENTAVHGAEITIYKIADAYIENNNLAFNYTEQFNSCDVSLKDLTEENLSKEISKCVKEDAVGEVLYTDENGIALFNNLDLGLYLVKQTAKLEGYSNFDSFLVMTPKTIDDKWTYDLDANPKTDVYKVIDVTVNKIWNSNNNRIADKVEIELYRGDELIDTVILNKDNNWSYTWNDIEKSDNYSVKEINIPKDYTVSYKVNGYTFTVTNTDTLANTGQIFYPIIILFVLGSTLVLIGIKLMRNDA